MPFVEFAESCAKAGGVLHASAMAHAIAALNRSPHRSANRAVPRHFTPRLIRNSKEVGRSLRGPHRAQCVFGESTRAATQGQSCSKPATETTTQSEYDNE